MYFIRNCLVRYNFFTNDRKVFRALHLDNQIHLHLVGMKLHNVGITGQRVGVIQPVGAVYGL